jgi:hypothetical protein
MFPNETASNERVCGVRFDSYPSTCTCGWKSEIVCGKLLTDQREREKISCISEEDFSRQSI